MTPSVLTILTFFFYLTSTAQNPCDSSNLSSADKKLIQKFWTQLKSAIAANDKNALAKLCSLPFECSYCDDNSNSDEEPKVTKATFLKKDYKIFFEPAFKATLKKDSLHVTPNYGDTKDKCTYRFGYTLIKETKTTPGQQRFFVIEKVNGQFKVTATWTVP